MNRKPPQSPEPSPDSSSRVPNPRLGSGVIRRAALPLIGAGAALSAWSLWYSPTRFGFAYLAAWCFVWSVVVGSLFFLGLHYSTNSLWSLVYRRVAEALASPAILLALLFIPVLVLARRIYPWLDLGYVAHHPSVQAKAQYLRSDFFVARAVVCLVAWALFARLFVRRSLSDDALVARTSRSVQAEPTVRSEQRTDLEVHATQPHADLEIRATQPHADLEVHANRLRTSERSGHSTRAWSHLFLVVFAFTLSFASFDWVMSLSPAWSSTMFGVYLFAGMAVTALSTLALAVLGLRRAGALGPEIVDGDHLYSLGALMFAFSCFWGYIALSQFLLIWYGNMPEETVWFVERWRGGWVWMSLALMGLRFVLPFLALMSRASKTNPRRLVWVACFLLVGQVVDLYWLILPQVPGGASGVGPSGGLGAGPGGGLALLLSDVGPLLLLTGLWLAAVGRFMGRHSMVAAGDPQWEESLRFELRV